MTDNPVTRSWNPTPPPAALSDPLWGRTFDLAHESEVAALVRAR